MENNFDKSSPLKDEAEISFQIVLTGDNATGKSCLLERFCSGEFKLLDATVGYCFNQKTIFLDCKKIQLKLFDTAGYQGFYPAYRHVYCKADGIVMVYDITRQSTLPGLRDRWIKEIRENAIPDVPIILVGSKCDLENERMVQRSEVEEICTNIPEIKHAVESSAKTNENIEFIFNWLATEMKRRLDQKTS